MPTPSTTPAPTRQNRLSKGAAGAILFGIFAAALVYDANDQDIQTLIPGSEPMVMPKLRGMEVIYAAGELEDVGVDWVTDEGPDSILHDLSYLHREVDDPWGWKIWSTVPKAGTVLEPGQEITVFALENREFGFFKNNPRMPETGWKFQKTVPGIWDGPMANIGSLTVERYVTNMAPAGARTEPDPSEPSRTDLPRRLDPSIEPKLERYLRNRLKRADGYDQFMGTIPPAGKKLRPGRAIIVLYRPEPEPEREAYPPGGVYDNDFYVYVDDDDDDDWNVPGWLCPTRFC